MQICDKLGLLAFLCLGMALCKHGGWKNALEPLQCFCFSPTVQGERERDFNPRGAFLERFRVSCSRGGSVNTWIAVILGWLSPALGRTRYFLAALPGAEQKLYFLPQPVSAGITYLGLCLPPHSWALCRERPLEKLLDLEVRFWTSSREDG